MLFADIEKTFSSFTLSVSIRTEGRTAFAGPSGSGKSVTLKCIAGIMRPDRGHIEYNGHVLFDSEKHIDLPSRKRRVGYLFQNYALFPDMSVRQNILAGLHAEKNRDRKLDELDKVSRFLHLENVLDSKPHELSGGEAQRTALARMIVNGPDIMLFDEPFSALDVYLREEIRAEFISIMDMLGKDYVIVTHSMDEAYSLSSMIYIMDQGKVIRSGRTPDVFSDPLSMRGARITGYRNIARAEKKGERIIIPDWGISAVSDIPDAVGACIMEGDIYLSDEGYRADVIRIVRMPDSVLAEILLEGASASLWMKLPPEISPSGRITVSFAPSSLKFLRYI